MRRTVRQLCDFADTILNEYIDKLMMVPKQSNSGNENWFSSLPYQAKATGVLTICIGTAFAFLYFFDQSSKISTAPVAPNPSPNPNPNPQSTNTDLSSSLEINTSNPNSNLPTPSNPKAPFSTPNLPGQSLTPFTNNNSGNIPDLSNSNINPNTGINSLNTNGQTRESLSRPVGDNTDQSRNSNSQTPNISTTSVPELDNIAATKTQQNPQVIPPITPQNNREISPNNINPTGTINQTIYPGSRNQINRPPISIKTPLPPTTLPILPNQSSPIASLPQIDNIAVNRNIKKTPLKTTNIPGSKPQKTIIASTTEEIKPKIKPLPEIRKINDNSPINININNPSNRSQKNISSHTQTKTRNIVVTGKTEQTTPNNPQKNQNIAEGKGKIAVNNSQTNPKRENKVTQNTPLPTPAIPPVSEHKLNPPTVVSVSTTLPPNPPIINPPSNDNLSSNINNTQSTPISLPKSDITSPKPSPPSLKRGNSEKIQNDSYQAKNSDEILIENPDKIAINANHETPPPNVIIPQVAEVKEYLQTRWKVPDGLNKSIEYILVLDYDGTITQIQALGETAKKYRESTNIPAPGDKFVSPLSLGKLPKIRVVFHQDGKVQTFLQDE